MIQIHRGPKRLQTLHRYGLDNYISTTMDYEPCNHEGQCVCDNLKMYLLCIEKTGRIENVVYDNRITLEVGSKSNPGIYRRGWVAEAWSRSCTYNSGCCRCRRRSANNRHYPPCTRRLCTRTRDPGAPWIRFRRPFRFRRWRPYFRYVLGCQFDRLVRFRRVRPPFPFGQPHRGLDFLWRRCFRYVRYFPCNPYVQFARVFPSPRNRRWVHRVRYFR